MHSTSSLHIAFVATVFSKRIIIIATYQLVLILFTYIAFSIQLTQYFPLTSRMPSHEQTVDMKYIFAEYYEY